jgi:site-specific DNA recombinase
MEVKRQVIGSMYPENLCFDGEQLRTTRINEAVQLIYTLDKGLPENEKGQNGNLSILSSQVGMTGFELRPLLLPIQKINSEDIHKLA